MNLAAAAVARIGTAAVAWIGAVVALLVVAASAWPVFRVGGASPRLVMFPSRARLKICPVGGQI